MKTSENQNTHNTTGNSNQTNQNKTPQANQNPQDQTRTPQGIDKNKQPEANTTKNTQIPNPGKQPSPQEDPIRKQPQVDPDPTSPSPDERRTDPYASKDQGSKTNPNDLKERNDKDAFPTGKSKDSSINETTTHKPTSVNPSTERNSDRNSGIDRENTK